MKNHSHNQHFYNRCVKMQNKESKHKVQFFAHFLFLSMSGLKNSSWFYCLCISFFRFISLQNMRCRKRILASNSTDTWWEMRLGFLWNLYMLSLKMCKKCFEIFLFDNINVEFAWWRPYSKYFSGPVYRKINEIEEIPMPWCWIIINYASNWLISRANNVPFAQDDHKHKQSRTIENVTKLKNKTTQPKIKYKYKTFSIQIKRKDKWHRRVIFSSAFCCVFCFWFSVPMPLVHEDNSRCIDEPYHYTGEQFELQYLFNFSHLYAHIYSFIHHIGSVFLFLVWAFCFGLLFVRYVIVYFWV